MACVAIAIIMAACSHKTSENSKTSLTASLPETSSKPRNVMPDATAFRMSGDFQNNVAISLSPDGEIIYYPAPSDITADSAPINLGEGWWLNQQGIGPNSVFTSYTFAEYAALPEAPSIQQLKLSIIPGAKVTEFIELPMKFNEASGNIDAVKKYLKDR